MDRKRRIAKPGVELLDRRQLMTVTPDTFAAAAEATEANSIVGGFAASQASGQVAPPSTLPISPIPNSSQATVTTPGSSTLVPIVPYQGNTPTAAELANEKYTAVFSGTYTTGAPRFTDQLSQTYIQAVGSTTDELHGDVQLSIIVPNGPSTTNPQGDVEGVAVNLDRSTASGAVLALDIYGTTQSSLNTNGLPAHLQFSYSPFTGSGSFTGGLYNLSEGAGTVNIYYKPSKGKNAPGVTSHGDVTVVIQGLIYKTGVTNPFATASIEEEHSVPKPFGPNLPKVVNKASNPTTLLPKT